ncbi:MAG: FAD-binding oxidoreductase [Rubrivivax sp.]|nr:FAD-binding oxidoreductase [Rubrivivax sp.]
MGATGPAGHHAAGPRGADVVVVGAGIHGCSTALFLARLGASVLVLEKDHCARHASGVNAGGVRQLIRHAAEIPLSILSMGLWERITELTGDDCGFESHGQVLVAECDEELEAMRERVADLQRCGFTHEELVDRRELKALVPAVADHCPGGIVSRRDGAAMPFRSTQAICRAAQRAGARLLEGVAVNGLKRQADRWLVSTSAGEFSAPVVVNAAGAWADRLAAAVGEPVPLEPIAPMLMITSRVPAFIQPVVILRSRKLSFKQFANGTVMIGGGHLAALDRDRNHTQIDWRKLQESARTVWELFPVMRGATIVRAWAGIEGRLVDDLPVVGASRTAPGFFHQFGFSAHGFQLGPGTGQAMAELITTGRSPVPIDGLDVGRFARGRRAQPPV